MVTILGDIIRIETAEDGICEYPRSFASLKTIMHQGNCFVRRETMASLLDYVIASFPQLAPAFALSTDPDGNVPYGFLTAQTMGLRIVAGHLQSANLLMGHAIHSAGAFCEENDSEQKKNGAELFVFHIIKKFCTLFNVQDQVHLETVNREYKMRLMACLPPFVAGA